MKEKQNDITWEQVWQSQITQQIVDGVVKPSVFENGSYDQKIWKNNYEANSHAQSDNSIVTTAPVWSDALFAKVVKKKDIFIIMAFRGV